MTAKADILKVAGQLCPSHNREQGDDVAKFVGILKVQRRSEVSPLPLHVFGTTTVTTDKMANSSYIADESDAMRDHEARWKEHDQFVCRVHQSLDVERTCYTIANEARWLIGCDRLSVVVQQGKQARLRAISSIEQFDRRSSVVLRLQKLVEAVAETGEPFWFDGSEDIEQLPLAAKLQSYLRESPTRLLGIVPLFTDDSLETDSENVGALVVEQFEDDGSIDDLRQHTMAIARHCGSALSIATSVANLPLMPLVRTLAKFAWFTRLRQLPMTLGVLGILALVVAAMAFVPAGFTVEARGELQPVEQETIFAPHDGVVQLPFADKNGANSSSDGLASSHNFPVLQGEEVVVLDSSDINYELTAVLGELGTTEQQIDTVSTTLTNLAGRRRTTEEDTRFNDLSSKLKELEKSRDALRKRLEILRKRFEQLTVKASMDGQVQTWDVVQQLRSRPVRRGQKLLTIVNPTGPWIVEARVPDHHIGYVHDAQDESQFDLDVSFILKSDPGTTYHGHIQHVAMSTEVVENHGPSVLVTVKIDEENLPAQPRPGTSVIARIHCGRASIGYVWLHDLIETVRSKLFF